MAFFPSAPAEIVTDIVGCELIEHDIRFVVNALTIQIT